MVQLHGFEYGSDLRPTADIDLLADARRRPEMTEQIARLVIAKGGQMAIPPMNSEKLGFRFELNGQTVEVLGPDGLGRDPHTIGRHVTFQVPGGTQALLRTAAVPVSLDGNPPVEVRRPSLLGAILIKARVLAARRGQKKDADLLDVVRLLSFMDDPRGMANDGGLKNTEKRWLRTIQPALDFRSPAVVALLSPTEIARAVQAYRLLVQ